MRTIAGSEEEKRQSTILQSQEPLLRLSVNQVRMLEFALFLLMSCALILWATGRPFRPVLHTKYGVESGKEPQGAQLKSLPK